MSNRPPQVDPTPEEIRELCEQINRQWSERERSTRAAHSRGLTAAEAEHADIVQPMLVRAADLLGSR